VGESEVRQALKAAVVHKARGLVKERAQYAETVRRSPERYGHVQSKVKRNLNVQKSVNRRSRKQRLQELYGESPKKGPEDYQRLTVRKRDEGLVYAERSRSSSPFSQIVQGPPINISE
jgi:hypothetical protein